MDLFDLSLLFRKCVLSNTRRVQSAFVFSRINEIWKVYMCFICLIFSEALSMKKRKDFGGVFTHQLSFRLFIEHSGHTGRLHMTKGCQPTLLLLISFWVRIKSIWNWIYYWKRKISSILFLPISFQAKAFEFTNLNWTLLSNRFTCEHLYIVVLLKFHTWSVDTCFHAYGFISSHKSSVNTELRKIRKSFFRNC